MSDAEWPPPSHSREWPGADYRLGLDGPPTVLVCLRCGCLVLYGSVDDHDAWHRALPQDVQ